MPSGRLITMRFTTDELLLLQEAMERFTRSVGGDLAREKKPSDSTKKKMTETINLLEQIRAEVKGSSK
jgi:hypothetical protein